MHLLFCCVIALGASETADVCVYGGTSGGVAAAIQVARMGKSVVLLEPGRHLGGMTAGGLSAVDIGDPRSVGGIAREFFTALAGQYGRTLAWDRNFEAKHGEPATGGAFAIEPHSAEALFNKLLGDAKVAPRFNAELRKVNKRGARIESIECRDGTVVRARQYIDATYEGDLMAAAGVSHTLLREGNARYGETYNGIYYQEKFQPRTNHLKPGPSGRVPGGQGVWDRDVPLDPYRKPGDPASGLLPLVQAGEPGRPGDPAPGVQAYCYRLCLTTRPDNRIPIAPPPGYDPARYELVARFIAGCQAMGDEIDLRWFSKHDPLPNDKWDFNTATFGANMPGASWAWCTLDGAGRAKLAKEHENYHRGLLHFLATDPRVPKKVRDDIARFGLPRDEFTDNGGWPHQIYIREGRRMVSDLVMTEHHTFGRMVAPRSVGLGSYGTDTHEIRRIVKDGVVVREGKTAMGRDGFGPYQIGYGALAPRQSECDNLLVTFAVSASHTAFSSIRMEPVFMVLSQSAATAACLAIDAAQPVQQVDYAGLRKRLTADGQILDGSRPTPPSPPAGKEMASATFDQEIPAAWQPGGRKDSFRIVEGALEGVCSADDSHGPWIGLPIEAQDLIVTFRVKFEKAGAALVLVDGTSRFGGQAHLARLSLGKKWVTLQQDRGSLESKAAQAAEKAKAAKEGRKPALSTAEQLADPRFYRTESLGRLPLDPADGAWHDVRMELRANRYSVWIDGQAHLDVDGTVLDAAKSRLVFLVGQAGRVRFDDVRVFKLDPKAASK